MLGRQQFRSVHLSGPNVLPARLRRLQTANGADSPAIQLDRDGLGDVKFPSHRSDPGDESLRIFSFCAAFLGRNGLVPQLFESIKIQIAL